MLRRLKRNQETLSWLCAGDFNEILLDTEKMGGALRPDRQKVNFREALEECELAEVKMYGSGFTWKKG